MKVTSCLLNGGSSSVTFNFTLSPWCRCATPILENSQIQQVKVKAVKSTGALRRVLNDIATTQGLCERNMAALRKTQTDIMKEHENQEKRRKVCGHLYEREYPITT